MGHQLNLYLTHKDTEMVEDAIRAIEPVAILHRRSKGPAPRVLTSLRHDEDGHTWLFFDLVRPADLAMLPVRHVAGPDYWTVDVQRDPVLEFNRCFSDGRIIRRGRVYFVSSYFGPDGAPVMKDEAFVKWGRKVVRRIRSILTKHGGDCIGPEAKALLDASQVSLVT